MIYTIRYVLRYRLFQIEIDFNCENNSIGTLRATSRFSGKCDQSKIVMHFVYLTSTLSVFFVIMFSLNFFILNISPL